MSLEKQVFEVFTTPQMFLPNSSGNVPELFHNGIQTDKLKTNPFVENLSFHYICFWER